MLVIFNYLYSYLSEDPSLSLSLILLLDFFLSIGLPVLLFPILSPQTRILVSPHTFLPHPPPPHTHTHTLSHHADKHLLICTYTHSSFFTLPHCTYSDKGSMIIELQERLQSTVKQLSSARGTGPENTAATR